MGQFTETGPLNPISFLFKFPKWFDTLATSWRNPSTVSSSSPSNSIAPIALRKVSVWARHLYIACVERSHSTHETRLWTLWKPREWQSPVSHSRNPYADNDLLSRRMGQRIQGVQVKIGAAIKRARSKSANGFTPTSLNNVLEVRTECVPSFAQSKKAIEKNYKDVLRRVLRQVERRQQIRMKGVALRFA